MPRRVRVRGAVTSAWLFHHWIIALNVTLSSYLTMFVLFVAAMLGDKPLRLKAQKRRLTNERLSR